MRDYIELKRNFVPVAEDKEPDLDIGQLWGRKYGGWLDWSEVLDHARVVLLAEDAETKGLRFSARHPLRGPLRGVILILRDGLPALRRMKAIY